jgi:hypothetical protein
VTVALSGYKAGQFDEYVDERVIIVGRVKYKLVEDAPWVYIKILNLRLEA